MQLVRGNAHNMPVFGVHVTDAEEVLPTLEEVVVELIPERHGREPGAGVFRQRVQGDAVGIEEDNVEHEGG